MAQLILIRHGLSEWNKLSLWTGKTDIGLHPEGVLQAKKAAEVLKGTRLDKVYVSGLKRAQQTWENIKHELNIDPPVTVCSDLNERDYGIFTGKNKWQVRDEVGEEEFTKIRRAWDHPIPQGETMKDVYARVLPCFTDSILPDLKAGKNILVVAHGNSIRALMKHLEHIPEDKISDAAISVGEARCYEFNDDGEVCSVAVKNKVSSDV